MLTDICLCLLHLTVALVNSTQLMADWNNGHVETVPSLLRADRLTGHTKAFLTWYGNNIGTFLGVPLMMRPIVNETTGGTPRYKDFAVCVSAIARTMLQPDFEITPFTNEAARSKERPDIMVVLHKKSVSATAVLRCVVHPRQHPFTGVVFCSCRAC